MPSQDARADKYNMWTGTTAAALNTFVERIRDCAVSK